MKMLAALLLGCALVSGGAARAEKIDFSTTTCKQFLEGHKDSIGVVLAWLDGYYQDASAPPSIDKERFIVIAKKIGEYCAKHPDVSLITATDELFGSD